MFIHVNDARYIGDYKVWLSFNDGTQGEVDLESELYGEIFEPLKDVAFFKSFTLEGHTLSWSNGADFAPEFLHELVTCPLNDALALQPLEK
ncbi:MAG: DUF2442 domain-containing protein [Chlorobaculum sp.]|jgi:hypothetical protein|nr:DUF2442 domain-containing protein [Chlorobaculum sp.]